MNVVVEAGRGRGRHKHAKVVIDGSMTIYDAAAGKPLLLAALDAASEISIDVSGVTEMDTAGLQLLVLLKREAVTRGRSVRLESHRPAVLEILDRYRLAAYFGDAVVIPSDGSKAPRA